MALNAARVASLLFVALSLAPYGAHVLELANKIDLPREEYLIVQQIYRGWALLGIVFGAAWIGTVIFAFLSRHDRRQFTLAVGALLCVVAAQIVFWLFTFPTNEQTRNWTELPETWEPLRAQWEYSHAAGAFLTLLALVLLLLGVYRALRDTDTRPPGS
jgi:formate hydrogenlyase subunit 3/multisubunit Na+/H+ antiporter MnhD subunit